MTNPYEAPQSQSSVAEELPQASDVPAKWWIVVLSLLAFIPPCCLIYGAGFNLYAMHFDPSLIPKDASAPGYAFSYIALPLLGIWILAQLSFLFSLGKRAGKGLAIVNIVFAVLMLCAVIEGLADWLGFTSPRPDLPPKAEQTHHWYFIIFTGLTAYFSLLAYGHWKVHQFYRKQETST